MSITLTETWTYGRTNELGDGWMSIKLSKVSVDEDVQNRSSILTLTFEVPSIPPGMADLLTQQQRDKDRNAESLLRMLLTEVVKAKKSDRIPLDSQVRMGHTLVTGTVVSEEFHDWYCYRVEWDEDSIPGGINVNKDRLWRMDELQVNKRYRETNGRRAIDVGT